MIYISHRGNINVRQPEQENHPDYILDAFKLGYDVEIDFWLIGSKMVLGHDEPQYEVGRRMLIHPNILLHAKNIEALSFIVENSLKGFWHTYEDYVLTTTNKIWVYPGKFLPQNSIAVLPETVEYSLEDLKVCSAICSDDIQRYKEMIG